MPPKAIKPQIDNPYPLDYRGEKIVDFTYETPLVLRREIEAVKMRGGKDDAEYVVGADYVVSYHLKGEVNKRKIVVPKGMLTDLSSSPRAAWALVAPVGPHLEASIVHDFLYIAWQDLGMEPRSNDWDFADNSQVGPQLEASIIHDFLYVAWQDLDRGARRADQLFADNILRAGMIDAEVTMFERFVIYLAVRLFGWSVYKGRDRRRYQDLPAPVLEQAA